MFCHNDVSKFNRIWAAHLHISYALGYVFCISDLVVLVVDTDKIDIARRNFVACPSLLREVEIMRACLLTDLIDYANDQFTSILLTCSIVILPIELIERCTKGNILMVSVPV